MHIVFHYMLFSFSKKLTKVKNFNQSRKFTTKTLIVSLFTLVTLFNQFQLNLLNF